MYALLWQDVSADDLLKVEPKARNTYEEALELDQFLESSAAIQSVIIVSSPYHLQRAR
jgi:uncharacterized SAM-binding protein YcdF (DUF218 family)